MRLWCLVGLEGLLGRKIWLVHVSQGEGTAKNIWQVVLTGYIPQVRVQVTMPPYMPHHYAK